MTKSRKIILGVLAVLVVGVLAYLALQFYGYQRAVSILPDEGTELLFVEDGKGERYAFENNSFVRVVPEPLPDGVVVYESVPSPVVSGERIVIVMAPGVDGMVVGVAHANGDVTSLVGGGTNKSNLLVTADGTAVFATHPALAEEAAPAPEDPEDDDGVEETGTATAPEVSTVAVVPDTSAASTLVAVNIRTGAVTALGLGHSPRLLSDGTVRALAQEGVVDINLATGARTTAISFEGRMTPGGGLSPSGEVIALSGTNPSLLEFYRLAPGATPVHMGFVELEGEDITRVTFSDEEHVFLRTNVTLARLYAVPTAKLPVATPVATVALVQ